MQVIKCLKQTFTGRKVGVSTDSQSALMAEDPDRDYERQAIAEDPGRDNKIQTMTEDSGSRQ